MTTTARQLKLIIEARSMGIAEPFVLVVVEHASNHPSDAGRAFGLAEAVAAVSGSTATLAALLEHGVPVDSFVAAAARVVGPTRRLSRHRDAALRRDLTRG
jgi:hypothetical protein